MRQSVLPVLPNAKELPPFKWSAFQGEKPMPRMVYGWNCPPLGKQAAFKDYYSPLKAPGRTAWINLLNGKPTLILLDELPPYLDNAKSIAIGNSDLSRVTATALTNLFEAVVEKELGNVCIVLTDLVGLCRSQCADAEVLLQLQHEAQRHSMNLTPVQINTDEFYQILRKRYLKHCRIWRNYRSSSGYAKSVREANRWISLHNHLKRCTINPNQLSLSSCD